MGLFSLFQKFQVSQYEKSNGKHMNKVRGNPIFILYTIGRKTGKLRKTPLIYFKDGNNYLIVASNSGKKSNPSWYYNLKGTKSGKIQILDKIIECSFQIASTEEKERLWKLVINQAPFYDSYRKKTSRNIPIIMLTPINSIN